MSVVRVATDAAARHMGMSEQTYGGTVASDTHDAGGALGGRPRPN